MKDWAKERWRKLYLRESLEQRLWSVMARGLRDYLIRLAEDDGTLIRDDDDPDGALLRALGAHPEESELVRRALELLRRDGFLAGGTRSISIGNLQAAQGWESRPAGAVRATETTTKASGANSSTERVRRHRARLRLESSGAVPPESNAVTSSVSSDVSPVTSSVPKGVSSEVTSSRGVRNPDLSESFLEPEKQNQLDLLPSFARASGVARNVSPADPSVSTSVAGNDSSSNATQARRDEEDDSLGIPRSMEEALKLDIAERAALIMGKPSLAAVTEPERWSEVLGVAQAFAVATGTKQTHLGRYSRDAGVRALVELYAAGCTQSELEAVVKIVPKQAWWSAQGKRLGLSSLSIEVVRRNLPSSAALRPVSPQVAKVLEHVRRRREAG